jgi:hypothetical protein
MAAEQPQQPDLSTVHGPALSEQELSTFWEQGYLRLGHAAPQHELERLCARADEVLLGNVAYPGM